MKSTSQQIVGGGTSGDRTEHLDTTTPGAGGQRKSQPPRQFVTPGSMEYPGGLGKREKGLGTTATGGIAYPPSSPASGDGAAGFMNNRDEQPLCRFGNRGYQTIYTPQEPHWRPSYRPLLWLYAAAGVVLILIGIVGIPGGIK